jgi:hypothetical protein
LLESGTFYFALTAAAMSIFADATGHFDLWGGKQFSDKYQSSHSYWSAATRIWLWKAS